MPPPDTREILENPPENRPGTVIIFVTPAQSDIYLAERPIKYENQALRGRETKIKTTTNLLSFGRMEAGQQMCFTGFTVTYLNQPPCCGPFFRIASSNHKNGPQACSGCGATAEAEENYTH